MNSKLIIGIVRDIHISDGVKQLKVKVNDSNDIVIIDYSAINTIDIGWGSRVYINVDMIDLMKSGIRYAVAKNISTTMCSKDIASSNIIQGTNLMHLEGMLNNIQDIQSKWAKEGLMNASVNKVILEMLKEATCGCSFDSDDCTLKVACAAKTHCDNHVREIVVIIGNVYRIIDQTLLSQIGLVRHVVHTYYNGYYQDVNMSFH